MEQHLAYDAMAEDLAIGTEKLSDEARLFALRGDARHLDAYRYEASEVRTRDRAIQRVKAAGAAPGELAALAAAKHDLAEFNRLESVAMQAAQNGDFGAAKDMLFGADHERAEATVVGSLDHFRALVSARTGSEMHQAKLDSDRASVVAKVMLALTALLFLSVLYFVLSRRVAAPLKRMTGIVMRLARQDYAVEVPNAQRDDEIGDMTQAIQVFRRNGLERDRLEAERLADQRAKDSILEMMQRLQACQTFEELADVVARFAPRTFPDLAGRLYVLEENRNALSMVGNWLAPMHSTPSFAPTACWGVRRGRPHASNNVQQDVCCLHIADPQVKSLCIPLTAQGDTIGLLYFEQRPDVDAPQEAARAYLELMADNIALTLANMRLRQRLANLAAQDGLTGLSNRRCLDEALNGHARQADQPLACIMLDVDHFKRFNDQFGHDAGDAVLQHVGQVMRDVTKGSGVAYRFGGEEFTALLPNMDEAAAFALAEQLRNRIAAAPLAHHGRTLGHITISLGLAVSPGGGHATTLLRHADAALLQAKSDGRNRTVLASGLATADGERSNGPAKGLRAG
ncbi:MAG TPA: diguanylate cyclase [Hyphomonadaceae bacterium]|nr:diguanylate cyclase [Hyphomonadaceae bacterium]